jgi:hypothetical protein
MYSSQLPNIEVMKMTEPSQQASNSNSSNLKVGVVGLGYAGTTHMKAFSKHPETTLMRSITRLPLQH